jgi:hypothetical protein
LAKPSFQPRAAALPTAPVIQTKLKVREPNDKFEQEADRVAELTENDNGSILPSAAARNPSPVGSLQRLHGNQAMLQMRNSLSGPPAPSVLLRPSLSGILQRKCACGGSAGMSGECEECSKKQRLGLQTKLKINEPGDIYEREADRVADQVLAASPNPAVSGALPRIQRFAGQPTGQTAGAPASVDQVLASPGRPLEPALRQNMEQRFGYDFSRVRVHSDAAAEQSAQEVNANAYTVGHDIVFGAGGFAPGTHQGRRLIAHELTHVVQQSGADGVRADPSNEKRGLSPVSHAAIPPQVSTTVEPAKTALMRTPEESASRTVPLVPLGPGGFKNPFSTAPAGFQSPDDANPLYFQVEDRARGRRVTDLNILEWALDNIWGEARIGGMRRRIFSLFQRREGAALDGLWKSLLEQRVTMILSSHGFAGSDAAKRHFAEHLRANSNQVISGLYERAIALLFSKIKAAGSSRAIPPGATLVTNPATIAQIEDKPEKGALNLGYGLGPKPWEMRVDELWVGKRVLSVHYDHLYFEVLGHEGIYFSISGSDLRKMSAHVGKVGTDVAKATEGLVVLGSFIKGFLTAGASPAIAILDTAAKLIDMQTMFIASIGEWTGWYHFSHTCLSSTCQQYEACQKHKSADTCKSDLLKQAVKEATIVVPLAEQARECLHGDAEACGGIAPLFLTPLGKGVGELKPKFKEAPSRGEIKRPAGSSSKPSTPVAEQPAPRRTQTHEEPLPGAKPEPAAKEVPSLKSEIDRFAKKEGIDPKQLGAEIAELRKNASDPNKVYRPEDAHFDAEITTSDNRVTYKRESGTSFWDRCWNPCKRVGRLGPEVDKKVAAINARNAATLARLRVNPELHAGVEAAFAEIEAGKAAPPAPKKRPSPADIAKNRADAKKAFKYGDEPGQIAAEVQLHGDAPALREALGVSGKVQQSMHVAPSSFMKRVVDYIRDKAITALGERGKHYSFDQIWKDWTQDQRRLGRKEVTVQEFHDAMAEAIHNSPFDRGQKGTLFTLLHEELFKKHKLDPTGTIELPYHTTKALKPGPELDALKARAEAERKAKLPDPKRVARVAKEKADLRTRTIAVYEKIIKRLERSGDPKVRARAQLYRLEIAKLKKQPA